MRHLHYQGYYGTVDFDPDDNVLFGQLDFIRATVSYEGQTIAELKKAFEEAVNDYLGLCREKNVEPEKPFKGSFNVRVGRELHRKAAVEANRLQISLNEFVKKAILDEVKQCGGGVNP